jgi:hypothetical protein
MSQNIAEISPSEQKPEADLIKHSGIETDVDLETNKESEDRIVAETERAKTEQKKDKVLINLPKIKKRPALPALPRDETTLKVEKILAEGLEEDYKKLPPIVQQEFKLKGEQTASKISELLKATKVKIKSIFRLILEWLSLLPNVNRFFLEQEAKIKTDRVINLKK